MAPGRTAPPRASPCTSSMPPATASAARPPIRSQECETMPVGTPTQTDFETQNRTIYKGNIDNAIAAQARLGWAFAPHESDPAAMTVPLDAGAHLAAGKPNEVTGKT